MREKNGISVLKEQYAKLTAHLSATGLILQGTITERTIKKKESGVRGGTKTLGPYYQWTFKRDGKTVTVNLSQAQTKRFQKAIDNHKKASGILNQRRELYREILEASHQCVARLEQKK